MLNAALLGVVDGLDCGPSPRSATATPSRTPTATRPHTLAEALDALEADTVLVEAMGSELVAAYLALRRHEFERAGKLNGEDWNPEKITAWELDDVPAVLLIPSRRPR